MRIGIDFDNTIVCYDHAFLAVAHQEGMLPARFTTANKTAVRDAVRALENGEYQWQRLQGLVYGRLIMQATLFEGVQAFFLQMQAMPGVELYIVSHKTELAHHDPLNTNLRASALGFLEAHGFFTRLGLPQERVFFAATRDEKIACIAKLACDLFIDDLPEVLLDAQFPSHCERVFFSTTAEPGLTHFPTWQQVQLHVSGRVEMHALARALSPQEVTRVSELDKGGNSRIYKVETPQRVYALKRYPAPSARDPRDRLHTETLALQRMWQHGIRTIPEVVATSVEHSSSLLSWLDAEAVTDIRDGDIAQFTDFLTSLAAMSAQVPMDALPRASEACLSGQAIVQQVEQRVKKLEAAAQAHAGLQQFLSQHFMPYLHAATQRAQRFYDAHGIAFDAELPQQLQTLIPSDFGSHNALRTAQGLVFLDFEYFGWDDPVTSTANFLLHPAMVLSEAKKTQFCEAMERVFAVRDPLYAARLEALLPLFAARWCSIILGEFIPERFAHRVQSGQYRLEEKESVLASQMAKANAIVEAVAA